MVAFPMPRWPVVVGLALAAVLAGSPGARAAVVLPDGAKVETVHFERHIMGLFGRLGCNSGSCHGSFQGKGGFRLSLFGYEPTIDFASLTRDGLGRRINQVDPDSSLILLKGAGLVEHGGGRVFSVGSWQYQLLREWIANGAQWEPGSGAVTSVTVTPAEHAFKKAGQTQQLTVKAKFADGREENITTLCDFRTNNEAVAEIDKATGKVKAIRAGDTAIIVSYRGNVQVARVLVPMEAKAGFRYPQVPAVNYIDEEVFKKLKRLNIVPSNLASDTEFLRRVCLDTIGQLPTPDEVRAFLADKAPDKRAKKIDELLAHPLHAALWATKFSDITGNNTDLLENPAQTKSKRSQMWHDWFRVRVQANVPYDQIAKGVLLATSREGKPPEEWLEAVKASEAALAKGFDADYAKRESLDLYWRRQQNVPINEWGEKTAAAFMGVRLECAQCHKHPMDRWTQADYRSYANVFSQLTFGTSPEAKRVVDAYNQANRKTKNKQNLVVKEIYVGTPRGTLPHPDTNAPLPPKLPAGPEIKSEKGQDYRVALYEWLRQPDNPFFAPSFVNRVWGHYFGLGIVNPVDDFSQANPPSNPQLLAALAKDFVARNYDIRALERTILNSRTYQLSWVTNETNYLDTNCYSHSLVRPLMAEVVVDALNGALGTSENFGNDAPPGSKAIEVGASRVQNATVAQVFRIFGRPSRTSACDCDRAMEPALPQVLFRMTDTSILGKITANTGRLQQVLKSGKTDEQVLEELFLATLTRMPSQAERQRFADYRTRHTDRTAAFVDTLWALINTREFILNH